MAARTKRDAEDPEPERPSRKPAPAGKPGTTKAPRGGGENSDAGAAAQASKPKRPEARPRKGAGPSRPDPERVGALIALASGLEEIVPGLEILDRDLVFDEGGRADLVGVDPLGNLYLVLLAEGEVDRIVLDALDAYAFAERNSGLLSRHLGRKQPAANTQVIVICLEPSQRLYERFLPLRTHGVGLYRVRTLRSASGEHSYLVPWGDSDSPSDVRGGVERFLAKLAPGKAALVQGLSDKLSRLDQSLHPEAQNGSLVWRSDGEDVVRLEAGHDGLDAFFARETQGRKLREENDLDELAEGALQRLVSRWESAAEAADSNAEETPEPSADRVPAEGPILTPEEIDAFRD